MDRLFEIRDPEDMGRLLDHVHDRFYEISKVVYRADDHCLDIPITVVDNTPVLEKRGFLFNTWAINTHKAVLTVAHVIDYSLDDKADIDEGDINTISYEDGTVIVRGSLPVTLKVNVSSLHLRLDVDEEPFQTAQKTWPRLFGPKTPA